MSRPRWSQEGERGASACRRAGTPTTQGAERAGPRSRRPCRRGCSRRCRGRGRAAAITGSVACGPRKTMRTTAWPPVDRLRLRGGPRRSSGSARPVSSARKRARHRMLRPGEDVEDVALLDDAAGVDHGDLVGDRPHHRHLVGDEHDRQAELAVDASRAGAGSSGWSRGRAPRSLRRTAALSASSRARGRCRRAASGRRRARPGSGRACPRGRRGRAARRRGRGSRPRSSPRARAAAPRSRAAVRDESRLKCWKIMPIERRASRSARSGRSTSRRRRRRRGRRSASQGR